MPATPRISPPIAVKLTPSSFFDPLAVQDGEALDLQPLHGRLIPGPVDVQGHGVAHHHVGEGLGVRLAGLNRTDVLALSEHRHLVGEGHDLMELMGDD